MARPNKIEMTDTLKHNQLDLLELCSLLKQIMIINERSIVDISKAIGSAYPSLVKIMNGNNLNPTIKTLEKISKELGYNLYFNLKKK